jgi:hypothetical protein
VIDADANPTGAVHDGAPTVVASGASTNPVGTTGLYEFGLTPAEYKTTV